MKKMKKVISLLLSTAMCATLVPGTASVAYAGEEDITITIWIPITSLPALTSVSQM